MSYKLAERKIVTLLLVRAQIFSSPKRSDRPWVHTTPYAMGTETSFREIKRPQVATAFHLVSKLKCLELFLCCHILPNYLVLN